MYYRRSKVEGRTYFFTVNLADRQSELLHRQAMSGERARTQWGQIYFAQVRNSVSNDLHRAPTIFWGSNAEGDRQHLGLMAKALNLIGDWCLSLATSTKENRDQSTVLPMFQLWCQEPDFLSHYRRTSANG